MKVFVYGTLQSGGALFLREHAKNIKVATTKGSLYMIGGVWFPFADFEKDGTIHGEIHEYHKGMLYSLDRLELGAGYKRIEIVTDQGDNAWAYHYPYIDDGFTRIPDGKFDINTKRGGA